MCCMVSVFSRTEFPSIKAVKKNLFLQLDSCIRCWMRLHFKTIMALTEKKGDKFLRELSEVRSNHLSKA